MRRTGLKYRASPPLSSIVKQGYYVPGHSAPNTTSFVIGMMKKSLYV